MRQELLQKMQEIHNMLDLRSDTSTLPTDEMWASMMHAELGDGGRVDLTGRGEDPCVYRLEQLGAELIGKADAIFMPTGSLANHTAMYTAAKRGDKILVEQNAHIYINEKFDFLSEYGGKVPVIYHLTEDYQIDLTELEKLLSEHDIRVLCLENTHNYSSGTCLTPENTRKVCDLAHAYGVHVHLDGARIFNAAVSLQCDVKELTEPVDSLMFCLSKGLCAPVGSLLCGNDDFIAKAQDVRKLIGTLMRQAGIVAAAGVTALTNNIERLAKDHENAAYLSDKLKSLPNVKIDPRANQSNFVYVNVSPTGLTAQQVTDGLRRKGLLVAKMTDDSIRFATHHGIVRKDVEQAAEITLKYFKELNG